MHSNIIFPFMPRFPNVLLLSGILTEEQHDYVFSPCLPDHTRISFFLIRLL